MVYGNFEMPILAIQNIILKTDWKNVAIHMIFLQHFWKYKKKENRKDKTKHATKKL